MTNSKTDQRAPWHFWLIGVFLLLWQGVASFDYVATIFRYEPYLSQFPEEALAYYFAAPPWMYAMWGIAAIGGLISVVLILMRNKLALPIYMAAFACGVVAIAYSVINPPPGDEGSLMFSFVVVAMSALILIYLLAMKKNGVLR